MSQTTCKLPSRPAYPCPSSSRSSPLWHPSSTTLRSSRPILKASASPPPSPSSDSHMPEPVPTARNAAHGTSGRIAAGKAPQDVPVKHLLEGLHHLLSGVLSTATALPFPVTLPFAGQGAVTTSVPAPVVSALTSVPARHRTPAASGDHLLLPHLPLLFGVPDTTPTPRRSGDSGPSSTQGGQEHTGVGLASGSFDSYPSAAAERLNAIRLALAMNWHRTVIAAGPVSRELSRRVEASQSVAGRMWMTCIWQAGAATLVLMAVVHHTMHTLPPALVSSVYYAQWLAALTSMLAYEAVAEGAVGVAASTPLHFTAVTTQKKRFVEVALPLQAMLLDLELRCPTHDTLQFVLRCLQPELRLRLLLQLHQALQRARQLTHLHHQADMLVAEWAATPPQAYDLATGAVVQTVTPNPAGAGAGADANSPSSTSNASQSDPSAAAAAAAASAGAADTTHWPAVVLSRKGPAGAQPGARGQWWEEQVVGELESALKAVAAHRADLRDLCRLIWVLEAALAEADYKQPQQAQAPPPPPSS